MEYSQFLKTHVTLNITRMVMQLPRKRWYDEWGGERKKCKWYEDLFDQIADPAYDLIGDREEEENWRIPTEFWVVSDALAEALLRKGQLLTNDFGFWIWGRETDLDHPLNFLTVTERPIMLESAVLTQVWKESLRS